MRRILSVLAVVVLPIAAAAVSLAASDTTTKQLDKQYDARCQRAGFRPGSAAYNGCFQLWEYGRDYVATLVGPPAHTCRTTIGPDADTETVRCS